MTYIAYDKSFNYHGITVDFGHFSKCPVLFKWVLSIFVKDATFNCTTGLDSYS